MKEEILVKRPLRGIPLGKGRLASVSIKWVVDESPDLSHIGTFTDKWERGALESPKGHAGNEYKYFVSANSAVYKPKEWEGVSGSEKQKLIRKHGSLENCTRFYAKQDMKRMIEYCDGHWQMTGCVVTGTYGADEAEDALWGIESDCGEKYRKEVERDCIADVISELRSKLKGAKTA